MGIKENIIALWRNRFEEVLEEKRNCPECKSKKTVIRHIVKEPQQKLYKRWFVEWCSESNCPHWTCGFLPRRYKPQSELEWKNEKISKSSRENKNA